MDWRKETWLREMSMVQPGTDVCRVQHEGESGFYKG